MPRTRFLCGLLCAALLGPPPALAAPEVAAGGDPRAVPPEARRVSGKVNLSLTRTSGNASNELFHTDGQLVVREAQRRFSADAQANRGRDGGAVSSSNWRLLGNYDRFLEGKNFVYGRAALEQDSFKDLRQRASLGVGYGYQWLDGEPTVLALRGGLDYVNIDRYVAAGEGYAAFGWAVDFRHRLDFLHAELFHAHDGTRGLDARGNVVVHSRTGLRLPLAAGLNASLQLNVDRESRPAPGRKTTDTTLLFGFGYELR